MVGGGWWEVEGVRKCAKGHRLVREWTFDHRSRVGK